MPIDQINLDFSDGMLFTRMEKLIDKKVPATGLFSGPYYFVEQLGFRKIIDTTFLMATSLKGDYDPEDVEKFMRALKRAQKDIDLRPEKYTHHYAKEFPKKFHDRMDTRSWGPGERIVFESYSKEIFDETFHWIDERGIFDDGLGSQDYSGSVISAAE